MQTLCTYIMHSASPMKPALSFLCINRDLCTRDASTERMEHPQPLLLEQSIPQCLSQTRLYCCSSEGVCFVHCFTAVEEFFVRRRCSRRASSVKRSTVEVQQI